MEMPVAMFASHHQSLREALVWEFGGSRHAARVPVLFQQAGRSSHIISESRVVQGRESACTTAGQTMVSMPQ